MSYELPVVEEYSWTDSTFGATTVVHTIVGPRGRVGFVRDITVDIATSIVGTTTVPEIAVGISSGDSTFGRYRLGTTASLAYTGTSMHRASLEAITGNPPRTLGDFASHVVLDGGPYSTSGSVTGGSSTTVNPAGRIPYSPYTVTNVVNGAGNVPRIFLKETIDVNLKAGQTVFVQGIAGATGSNGQVAVSAISTTANWIETSGTFGGTYTTGGFVNVVVFVTNTAGSGSPAGGGPVKVLIQWIGVNVQ